MTNFKTPLRGQQELTLLGSEKTTSSLVVFIMQEISLCNISGITTKAPCEAALMGERHMRIEISDFVMRAFVLMVWSSKAELHLPVQVRSR